MASPRQTRASKLSNHSQIITRHTKPVSKKNDQPTPTDAPIAKKLNDDGTILWNEETEPILFRNVLRLKPVGPMKHWRMIMVRKRVSQALDFPVSSEAIWAHLSTLFDMKALEEMETSDKIDNKVESFTLPRCFLSMKNAKSAEVSQTKETRLRKNSNSMYGKGELDEDGTEGDESVKIKAESDTSNPGSPMATSLEETSRKSSSSKILPSSKRGKSSDGSKKMKTPSDRPKTPTELKRSRTPTGTKRVKHHSDDSDDEKYEETSGSTRFERETLNQLSASTGQSQSSIGSRVEDDSVNKKPTDVKHVAGKSLEYSKKFHDSKKPSETKSLKKHSDSVWSSSSKKVSDTKHLEPLKKSTESKTPGKKSSDGRISASSSSSKKLGGSSGSKLSKVVGSSRKSEDDATYSSSKGSDNESFVKRGTAGKVILTPKRPRTPTGTGSGKRTNSLPSGKKTGDANVFSNKKSSGLRGSKKSLDDPNDSDDALSSTMTESGRDTPSSTGDSTDTTPISASSTSGDSKSHSASRKRKTFTVSESERSGDSKGLSTKDSKNSNKSSSAHGKKNRRV